MINHVVTGTTVSGGESNINLLVHGKHYFVDKTLTINQFLTGPSHQLILRPRRCGKSHAISLLEAFLEAPSPNEVRPATLQAPFKGTLIDGESYKDLVKEHYKAHPILYMNLKDVRGLSLDEMHQEFHSSLLNPLQSCRDQLKHKRVDDTPLYTLHLIYDRPAIVLVDEYDAPLNHALRHNYLADASEFFGIMFSRLLKDNKHVGRSFMVGILKLAKSGWLSGLNNIRVFSLNTQDPRYGDSFLFTEDEVQEFLVKTNSPLQLVDLKSFYNSYSARGPGAKTTSLFNPWSVHNAIADRRLDCYWNQTSSYMPIRKAIWNWGPDFTDRLIKLFAGEEVELRMNDTVTYEDLDKIKEEDLWGLLYYAGYLTPVASLEHGPSTYFRIPNVEVRQEWAGCLGEFIEGNEEEETFKDLKKLLNPLLEGDAVEAQKALSKITPTNERMMAADRPTRGATAEINGVSLGHSDP